MTGKSAVRVLIVDDSAMVRKILSMAFDADPGFEVVGLAHNVTTAQKLLDEQKPDVITLDIEMPQIDGLTWLRQLMGWKPVPVVVISSLSQGSADVSMMALETGAVDVIPKPMGGVGAGLGPIMEEIKSRVRAAAYADLTRISLPRTIRAARQRPAWPRRHGQKVMAIGSSTGGVQALARILPVFPGDSPAILIVQHMPEGFTASFAKRLDGLCDMEVREAKDGDLVQDGLVLLAPGGTRHMTVRWIGALYRIALTEGTHVNFSRPSVDVLFRSVATAAGVNAVGAILTGMGRDGAAGLLEMRKAGGRTIAQDENTSVVYGMPAIAAEMGAANLVLPLDSIPDAMMRDPARPEPADPTDQYAIDRTGLLRGGPN